MQWGEKKCQPSKVLTSVPVLTHPHTMTLLNWIKKLGKLRIKKIKNWLKIKIEWIKNWMKINMEWVKNWMKINMEWVKAG